MMDRIIEQIAAVQGEGDDRFFAMEEKRMKLKEKMLLMDLRCTHSLVPHHHSLIRTMTTCNEITLLLDLLF